MYYCWALDLKDSFHCFKLRTLACCCQQHIDYNGAGDSSACRIMLLWAEWSNRPHHPQFPMSSFLAQRWRVEDFEHISCADLWYDATLADVIPGRLCQQQMAPHHVLNSHVDDPASRLRFFTSFILNSQLLKPWWVLDVSLIQTSFSISFSLSFGSVSWMESTSNTWNKKQLLLQLELSLEWSLYLSTASLASTSCQQSCPTFCQRSLRFFLSDPTL